MSFNWADDVEETLAGHASQGFEEPISQFAPPEQERADSILAPENECKQVAREAVSSPVQPGNTESPEAQPTPLHSGILQSRWATAPDEPVVIPKSQAKGETVPLEQREDVTADRNKKKPRGSISGRKGRRQRGRSSGSSLADGPRFLDEEGHKQVKMKTSNAHIEKNELPAKNGHTSTEASSMPTSNSAKSLDTANEKLATTMASGISSKSDGPAQASGTVKNEISLSRWA